MFEAAETHQVLEKATYDAALPALRERLLKAQYALLEARKFPVVVVIAGIPAAGRSETVRALSEWMDPRHLQVHAMGPPSDEELERPPMWRYWRRLPPKGKIGVFFGSWYTQPIIAHALKKTGDRRFAESLEEVRRFERMLSDEGALVLKFWFHLTKKEQKKRLDDLWHDKRTRYRVTKEDRKRAAHYEEFRDTSERALNATHAADTPWIVLEGYDDRYRNFNAARALLEAIEGRLATERAAEPEPAAANVEPVTRRTNVLGSLDLTRALEKEAYAAELAKQQRRLAELTRKRAFARLSPVLVFEGMDAAGKGGAIRRVTQALDPRIYDVHAIAAPSDEERAQPYLWRFWRHAPRDGKFAIFDRSWYGRVLVERVEGFAKVSEWKRAYEEINDFERQLQEAGNVVVKFWLQISNEKQLARFQEREQTPFKRFKITQEDWRNREKWADYQRAASEMIERTSTQISPWTLVEAEDKYFARVKVIRTICEAIDAAT
ncbi:MAG TPA: polyphosphate:AMP phosphotransferase [Polyangiaceae bacterium]|nr:polyphosphate:AMP phosphotransferase [Polyangiaceae bacterium]